MAFFIKYHKKYMYKICLITIKLGIYIERGFHYRNMYLKTNKNRPISFTCVALVVFARHKHYFLDDLF